MVLRRLLVVMAVGVGGGLMAAEAWCGTPESCQLPSGWATTIWAAGLLEKA